MHAKKQKLILYIEDEPELVDLLCLVLNDDQLDVQGALSGYIGLQMIRQLKPDLVLLDLMLPDMNGWNILCEMQQDNQLKEIPVIVITVCAESRVKRGLPQFERVIDYVTKPFSLNQVRETVGQALGIRLP